MYLFYLFIIIISTIISGSEFAEIDQKIGKFIVDVTTSMYTKSSFTAFFCIDANDAVDFSIRMSQNQMIHEIINDMENIDFNHIKSQVSSQSFFVLDLDCSSAPGFLIKVNTNGLFVAPSKWLILQDLRKTDNTTDIVQDSNSMMDYYEEKLRDIFGEFAVYPDSEVLVGQRLDDDFINLISLYRPSPYRSLIVEDRGSWNEAQGLWLCQKTSSSRRRQNLLGSPLKSCLVMTDLDTLNHLTDYKDKQIDVVTKANYIWVLHLIDRMNATINFTVRDTWGYRDKNGTWSGMIGLLDNGEIDIGGTATFFVPQRIGVIDYVQLYTPIGSKFVFRRPPLSYVRNLFTLPFGRSVWIATTILLIVVFFLLYISTKWEWKHIKVQSHEYPSSEMNPTLSDNFLIVLGSVSQQGFEYIPRTVSSRIIIIMLLLAFFSLYAAYAANIVALLQATSTSINTLKDLMESGLKIGIYDIVYNRYYFKHNDDPISREFNERMVENSSSVWMSLEEGVGKVRMGLFAFHMDTSIGYHVIQETFEEDEKCGLHEIDYLNLINPLLVIKVQSPYREIIRVGALWISETGLKGRDVPRLFTQKPTCAGQTSFINVGITECYAAILLMVYGIGISVAICFFELLWDKCFNNEQIDEEPDCRQYCENDELPKTLSPE